MKLEKAKLHCTERNTTINTLLALSCVLWMLNKDSNDLSDVQRIARELSKNKNKFEDAENDGGRILPSLHWKWISKSKDVEIACCERIKISSQGKTKEMYPFVLGDYKQYKQNINSFIKIGQPEMFLIQPETTGYTWAYTWGVSSSMKAKWGYVRSVRAQPCPTWAGGWMMYDKNTKTFVVDETLKVECSTAF